MWHTGTVSCPATGAKFSYWVKTCDTPSETFGLDGGHIVKLLIRELGGQKDVASYERGWNVYAESYDAKVVLAILLEKYN